MMIKWPDSEVSCTGKPENKIGTGYGISGPTSSVKSELVTRQLFQVFTLEKFRVGLQVFGAREFSEIALGNDKHPHQFRVELIQ